MFRAVFIIQKFTQHLTSSSQCLYLWSLNRLFLAPITSPSIDSPLSPSITPSLFHSHLLSIRLSNWIDNRFNNRLYRVYSRLSNGCQTGLTTYLFHKSNSRHRLSSGLGIDSRPFFFLATLFLFLVLFITFSVFFNPVRKIKLATRQLLDARKYSLSCRIVSYRNNQGAVYTVPL